MTPPSLSLRRLAIAAATGAAFWALPATAADEAVPAFKDLDSIEARVQGCVTCHGQNGQGTQSDAFPRIAAKPAGYLYNQLVAFRDGTRQYPPMNYLVAYLPDAYLREMAEYFAKQRPPFEAADAAPADAAMLARGKAIATGGDATKGIPLEQMRGTLTKKKVLVYQARTQSDGLMHMTLCGAPSGTVHIFTIPKKDLKAATKLGFKIWTEPKNQN